jgi:antitoxin component YwqK of YwqJK toxin-antitoxin module
MRHSIILFIALLGFWSVYSQEEATSVKITDLNDIKTHDKIIDNELKDSVYILTDSVGLVGSISLLSFNNYEYWPASKSLQIFILSDSDTVYHSKYVNDSLIETTYYQNGKISSIKIHSYEGPNYFDRIWIYQANYYENGQLFYESNPNKIGLKKAIQYYANGNIYWRFQVFYNLKSGFQSSGKSETFYENGQIKSQEFHTEYKGEEVFKSVEKGIWKYWDKKGELIEEINKTF